MVRFRVREPSLRRPFSEMDRLRGDMNRLFDAFYTSERVPVNMGVYPPVNVYEEGDTLYVTAELPGINPDDIDISVQGENLILKGEHKTDSEKKVSFHRKERRGGSFNRTLSLPEAVDGDKVTAEYRNGILKMTLPKLGVVEPKRIVVEKG